MNMYEGAHILNFSIRWGWVVTSPPGKEPPVPIHNVAGWAPEPVWIQWQREKNHFTAPAGNQTPAIQSTA